MVASRSAGYQSANAEARHQSPEPTPDGAVSDALMASAERTERALRNISSVALTRGP